jgi:hypothetical protein
MQTKELQKWSELKDWLEDTRWERKLNGKPQFAFRGQADASWFLESSLARHFNSKPISQHQWRTRELKMYQMFREFLIELCPGAYEGWLDRDIMALMQHYGVPTRFIDFSYSPNVAAWFALMNTNTSSAIWIVDRAALDKRRSKLNLIDYCGPAHNPYRVFDKYNVAQYKRIGSILDAKPNDRLAAQRGCFLVPGSISRRVDDTLVYEKVVLSERIAIESISRLSELGSYKTLFPNLAVLADEVKRFSVTGGEHYPVTSMATRQPPGK